MSTEIINAEMSVSIINEFVELGCSLDKRNHSLNLPNSRDRWFIVVVNDYIKVHRNLAVPTRGCLSLAASTTIALSDPDCFNKILDYMYLHSNFLRGGVNGSIPRLRFYPHD